METRLCISRWTSCSGHTWDVLLMWVWEEGGRRWLGCVRHRFCGLSLGSLWAIVGDLEYVLLLR